MITKFFTNQSKSITGAAILLGSASFVSRFIGIIRDRIFAHQFGTGDILDTYFAAFRIPDLIYNLVIVGALSAGFIPIFTKALEKNKKEAWQITSGIINILGFSLIIICSLLFIFAPQLVPYLVPGFNQSKLQTTIEITRIMFLSPILLGLSSIVSGVLQSFKAFLIYSLTPIFYNLGIIIGALFLVPLFGIKGLAYGVVLGALLHLLIQLPSLIHYGFKYHPRLFLQNKNIKHLGKLMIPRTLGLATTQLNLIVITIFASTIGVGSVAVFNFANNIQHFPVGIVGISFAIAAFPTLSTLMAKNKKNDLINHLSQTIRQILFFIIPLTIIFLLLRAQIVRVVLGSGHFDWNDTIRTANTLAFFTLSLLAQALIPLLVRTFFVLHDTWTPFLVGLVSSLINIIAGIYLKSLLGVSGLALAFSLSMIIQLALLWLTLRDKLGTLHESKMISSILKISAASIVMILVVQFLKAPLANIVDMTKFWGILTQGVVAGTTGLLVFAYICYKLKVEEIIQFKQAFEKKLLKIKPAQAEFTEADEV